MPPNLQKIVDLVTLTKEILNGKLHFYAVPPLISEPFSPYLSVFSPNARKYGPKYLQIRTLFKQCYPLLCHSVPHMGFAPSL